MKAFVTLSVFAQMKFMCPLKNSVEPGTFVGSKISQASSDGLILKLQCLFFYMSDMAVL